MHKSLRRHGMALWNLFVANENIVVKRHCQMILQRSGIVEQKRSLPNILTSQVTKRICTVVPNLFPATC